VRLLYSILILALAALPACLSVEVEQRDKELFVRADEFSKYGVAFSNTEKYEKYEKTRYLDGSVEITYEFEPPEADAAYLVETVTVEPKESDARMGQSIEDTAIDCRS